MFEPNWASPPGDTISRLAAAGKISIYELAERIGFEEELFSGIMEGRVVISDGIADALSSELGASRQFWIERYNQFLADRARLAGSAPTEALSTWGQTFPVRALRELGWLPKGSRGERLSEDILSFFGCDSISGWNERYSAGIGQVAFRTSFAFETDEMATLAWLRIGEMQAENLTLAKFSASNFKKRLTELKKICALKRPEIFFPKLQQACAEEGVGLVSSKAPKGCRASGATWTSPNGNPIILLSFRYRGTQTVELQQGRHTILFAPGNGFSFEIDSDGIVNVEAPFDHAAEGSDGTLTFLTSSIGINFGDYQGRIEILGATEVLEPTTTTIFVEVLNGIENWVFQLAPGTAFRFDTDEFGAPIIDPVYASVSNRVLSLNTTTIVIDPSSYTGNYGVTNVTEDSDRPRRVELIPGVDQYILNFAPGTGLRFDIDEQGNVTSSSRGAEGDGAALRLMPRTLPVEPINPNVGWFIIGAEANTPIAGSRMVTLVPDVAGWALSVGPGTVGRFALDEQSIPVPPVVTVFQGTLVHEFILGGTRDEVTCQFSGEIDLRQDLNGGVPNQESGPEILLSGDMLVGLIK